MAASCGVSQPATTGQATTISLGHIKRGHAAAPPSTSTGSVSASSASAAAPAAGSGGQPPAARRVIKLGHVLQSSAPVAPPKPKRYVGGGGGHWGVEVRWGTLHSRCAVCTPLCVVIGAWAHRIAWSGGTLQTNKAEAVAKVRRCVIAAYVRRVPVGVRSLSLRLARALCAASS